MVNRSVVFFSIGLIIFSPPSFAQQSKKESGKPSCPEKWWAITHPFVACKAHKLSLKAREASHEMEHDSVLDHDADGGQVDAFRHAYWMALLSQHISPRKAR